VARISGVNIRAKSELPIGLTYIHGIGPPKPRRSAPRSASPGAPVHELTDDEVLRIREADRPRI